MTDIDKALKEEILKIDKGHGFSGFDGVMI